MHTIKFALVSVFTLLMLGCDNSQNTSSQSQTRTMIIGGMPAHDHDYQLARPEITAQNIEHP